MPDIGDLVAKLTVNNTGFTKGLSSASSSLKSFASGVGGIVAPIAGALAAVWGTSASISGYKTALENQRKFQAVLESTGGTAGITTAEMADYAAELQRVTNFEDDATMGAAAYVASLQNVNGDNFKRTIALAQDMATVMGTDLDSAVKKMGKSFKDLSPEEVTAKLDEMRTRFGGAAQAVADPWKQFQNTLGDVGENIGSVLLPSINVLAGSLTSMMSVVADGAASFKSFGIESAVVISHLGSSMLLAGTQAELFIAKTGLDFAHFFTSSLPMYLDWFGKNWASVFLTAVDYASTVFINLGQNIRNVWSSILSFFKTGKFEFNWTPLTEGFKNSIAELPDVPIRAATEFEAGLQASIDAQTEALSTSMDAQREELTKQFSPLEKAMPTGGEMIEPDSTKAASKGKDELAATFRGSQEAARIMLGGVGGGKSVEQIATKQLTVQEKTLQAIKDNKPPAMMAVDFGAA